MADLKHCFGCRHSVYVDNVRKNRVAFSDRVCLYCFKHHKYISKREFSNPQCFECEDKNNPSTLMEKDVRFDRIKYNQNKANAMSM